MSTSPENIVCPVCGYLCVGKGGVGCIDKPSYQVPKVSKIEMIKGTSTTPPVFCAKLMEGSDQMENIACVVQYKDGHTRVFSTDMKNVDVAWLRWCFDKDFQPGDINDER